MPVIARYSRCGAVLLALCLAGGCESAKYREQEIRIVVVVPTATPRTKVVVAKAPVPERRAESGPGVTETATREMLAARWDGIERLLAERKLTAEDLGWILPEAKDLATEIAQGDPKIVVSKITNARRTLDGWVANRDFVNGKLGRIRKQVEQAPLRVDKAVELNDRLDAVPRLVEEEKYGLANETLTFIREEIPAPLEQATPTADGTASPSSVP